MGGGAKGACPPLAHDGGILTLDPKLHPLPSRLEPVSAYIGIRWTPALHPPMQIRGPQL